MTLHCSWSPATRRPFTDEPWLTRVYRCCETSTSALQFLHRGRPVFNVFVSASSHICQDYLSSSSDLQEVLQLDPNVREAEQELEVVTALLRQSLMENAAKVEDTLLENAA